MACGYGTAIKGVSVFYNSAKLDAPHLEIAKWDDEIKFKILSVKLKTLFLILFLS